MKKSFAPLETCLPTLRKLATMPTTQDESSDALIKMDILALNTAQIAMLIGRDNVGQWKPFENPEGILETYSHLLILDGNDEVQPAKVEVNCSISKEFRKHLRHGLRLLGVQYETMRVSVVVDTRDDSGPDVYLFPNKEEATEFVECVSKQLYDDIADKYDLEDCQLDDLHYAEYNEKTEVEIYYCGEGYEEEPLVLANIRMGKAIN